MALTGCCLVLFVTFHVLMNAVALIWPAAYNQVCEFLGANWYALVASAGLALLFILHILYAVWLTLQNYKARGKDRYAIAGRTPNVEWSSKNMLVLGVVVIAFLVVHLVQFWSKMQWQELIHADLTVLPQLEGVPAAPAMGTLFLQMAFSCWWTLAIYVIGFIALWFHLNHGFWSMFQSIGWNNTNWMPRLKKIGLWWTTIVIALFFAEGIVFTVKAHEKYYLTNETLREQYKDMIVPMIEDDFGPDAAQLGQQIRMSPYGNVSMGLRQMAGQMKAQLEQIESPEGRNMLKERPEMAEQIEQMKKQTGALENAVKLFDYLESADNEPNTELPLSAGQPN